MSLLSCSSFDLYCILSYYYFAMIELIKIDGDGRVQSVTWHLIIKGGPHNLHWRPWLTWGNALITIAHIDHCRLRAGNPHWHAVAPEPLGTGWHVPLHFEKWLGTGGHKRNPEVNGEESWKLVYAFTGTVVKETEDRFTNDIFLQISKQRIFWRGSHWRERINEVSAMSRRPRWVILECIHWCYITHCCCQGFCTFAAENVTFGTIVKILKYMTGVQTLMDQVWRSTKLMLMVPATSATTERSFLQWQLLRLLKHTCERWCPRRDWTVCSYCTTTRTETASWTWRPYSRNVSVYLTNILTILEITWDRPKLHSQLSNYTVFQKKLTPRTFMITVWNENQFK